MTNQPNSPGPSVSTWLTLTLLAIASLTVMANATIAPALPEMKRIFADVPGITTLVGLVMTLPSLSIALMGAPAGILADRFGKRRVLLIALGVYAAGGAPGYLADNLNQILIGRVILGLGVAGVMTAATALVGDFFVGPARNQFLGRQGAAQSLGGVIFLLAGGGLASLSWRYPFLLYLLAIPLIGAAWRFIPPRAAATRAGGPSTDHFPWVPVLGLAFIALIIMAAFYLIPTKLPFRMGELGYQSPMVAGIAVAASTLAGAASALLFPRVRRRFAPRAVLTAIFTLMALGYLLIYLGDNLAITLIGTAVAGLGVGLSMPLMMTMLLGMVPESKRGRASGIATTAIFLGQFISPLIGGPLSDGVGLPGTFAYFSATLAVCAAATLLSKLIVVKKKQSV